MRFCSCSRVTGDGGIIIGPPSIELESLSDALSRSAMFLGGVREDGVDDDDDGDDVGSGDGGRRIGRASPVVHRTRDRAGTSVAAGVTSHARATTFIPYLCVLRGFAHSPLRSFVRGYAVTDPRA